MATNAQAQERKEGCLAQLRRFRILDMVSYNMVFYAQAQERKEAKIFVFFPKAININNNQIFISSAVQQRKILIFNNQVKFLINILYSIWLEVY